MELREYQKDAIKTIWDEMFNSPSVLCVLPTGAGKTLIMQKLMEMCIEKKPDIKICILLNKIDLLEQTTDRTAKLLGDKYIGNYCGSLDEKDHTKTITIASIQSINSLDETYFNLIIIDEVHALNERSGTYKRFIDFNKSKNDRLKIIGFTATPYRESGLIYGKDKLFKKISFHLPMHKFINEGFLVYPVIKASNSEFDTSHLKITMGDYDSKQLDELSSNEAKATAQVEDALCYLKDRKKVVWQCINISHVELIDRILKSYGESSTVIHSKLSKDERDKNKYCFEKGSTKHLIFVTIVSEGYDYPAVDAIVVLRPTKSARLWVQTVGRGLRISEGKSNCLVLDYGQCCKNIGPIDDPIITVGGGKKKKKVEQSKLKKCKHCLTYNELKAKNCIFCNEEFKTETIMDRLSLKKENHANILKGFTEEKNIVDVVSVSIGKYISQNKNECVKIEYYYGGGFIKQHIDEFFSLKHDFAYKKMIKRLEQLGSSIGYGIQYGEAKNTPKKLEFEFDGKYRKIKRLIF